MISARRATHPVEGFLSLPLRIAILSAWLGLVGLVCAGQNAPAQNQPPQSQSSPDQSSSQNQSSSQDQSPPSQPAGTQEPKKPTPQKPAPQNQTSPNQYSEDRSPIALDSSETLFSVLSALNSCGYDQDLTISDATRSNVRAEVQRVLAESADAETARSALCEFYLTHTAERSSNRSLSPYISLALYMDGPPHFAPRIKEEDLPPPMAGAGGVVGFENLIDDPTCDEDAEDAMLVSQCNENGEDDEMDDSLGILAVIHRADAGDDAQKRSKNRVRFSGQRSRGDGA